MFKKQKIVFGTCVYFLKKSWTYVPKINFFNPDKNKKKAEQRREERWDRGEETKWKKKADPQSEKRWAFYEKSWLKKVVTFTKLPSKTVVLCSKSPQRTF